MMKLRNFAPVVFAIVAAATLGLTGCASGPTSVSGTEWGEPGVDGKPSIAFETDGSVNGSDGCNRVMGTWTEADGTVDLGELGSTMMFCEGVDTWLTMSKTAELDGNTLVFLDPSGEEIGKLSPAPEAK